MEAGTWTNSNPAAPVGLHQQTSAVILASAWVWGSIRRRVILSPTCRPGALVRAMPTSLMLAEVAINSGWEPIVT